jgi:hypothetical protein
MSRRIALLMLMTGFCSADVAIAEGSAIQPVEWIIKESAAIDMWAYIAPDGKTITFSRAVDRLVRGLRLRMHLAQIRWIMNYRR